jgi:hypothetical protein
MELVHLHGIGILCMRRLSCSLFASGLGFKVHRLLRTLPSSRLAMVIKWE